ncbi:MAG: ferredoxin family protein [Planctomycetes bacterium]|nr:ferredoxin family protein [Planctomycetota bacterium]
MVGRLAVVVSLGRGGHPAKRAVEETLVTALRADGRFHVMVIPHVYDVPVGGEAHALLQSISDDFVLLCWLGPRAARWTLAQLHVQGRSDPAAAESSGDESGSSTAAQRSVVPQPHASRTIHCLDLRAGHSAKHYVEEIERIASESEDRNRAPSASQDQASPLIPSATGASPSTLPDTRAGLDGEAVVRRWYPVIDYSRCTNCMECADFCLFGVYGLDHQENILVEQPDNCRPGCPACSRVCPENAILFPQHKTPQIAGDAPATAPWKIDLSQLFDGSDSRPNTNGEPEPPVHASDLSSLGDEPPAARPQHRGRKDELDRLMDELDEADL